MKKYPLREVSAEVEGGIFSWGCFGGSGHDPKSTVFPLEITQTCPKSEKISPAALKSQVIFQEIEGGYFFMGGVFFHGTPLIVLICAQIFWQSPGGKDMTNHQHPAVSGQAGRSLRARPPGDPNT